MRAGPAVAQPVHRKEENDQDDRFASPPGLWLPRTVVKRHRKPATIIWVTLIVGFLAYVTYVIWATVDSRKDPASSIALKQQYYTFPDVAVCSRFGMGCLDYSNECFNDGADNFFMVEGDQVGFVPFDAETFTEDHRDVTEPFEAMYPNCVLIPLSKLEVDEGGVRNGTVTSFTAAFHVLWFEGEELYDHEYYGRNQQFLDMYLLVPDTPFELFEGRSIDAKVPYKRLNMTTASAFEVQINHMVLGLTEFIGIKENGNKEQSRRTFTQTTTTGIENWWWDGEGYSSVDVSFMRVEMSIGSFEYTLIEEVDPVDIWSIVGAIGGVWQFVATGFGLFFVFAEKQSPDRKMRNFKKSVVKPAVVAHKRWSSLSIRASNQGINIDSPRENSRAEWVRKKRPNGSTYYVNTKTGVQLAVVPPRAVDKGGNFPLSRGRLAHGGFRAGNDSATKNVGAGIPTETAVQEPVGDEAFLCPGCLNGRMMSIQGQEPGDNSAVSPRRIGRADYNGRQHYINAVGATVPWERLTQRFHPIKGSNGRLAAGDPFLARMRRPLYTPSALPDPSSASSPAAAGTPPPTLGSLGASPSHRNGVRLVPTLTAAPSSCTDGDSPRVRESSACSSGDRSRRGPKGGKA
ncbi:unnamed protein product [Scytosiphon promiscuus]